MDKTQKTLAATALVTGVATIAAIAYQRQQYLNDLAGRFPSLYRIIGKKGMWKAYKQFLKNSAADKYGDMSNFSNEKMDRLFLDIVREQLDSK